MTANERTGQIVLYPWRVCRRLGASVVCGVLFWLKILVLSFVPRGWDDFFHRLSHC